MLGKIKKFFAGWNKNSSYMRWLMHYTVPYVPQLAVIMVLNLIGSLAAVSLAIIGKEMIDNASDGNNVVNTIFLYILVVLVSEAMTVISSLISVVINEKFSFGIRKQVYRKVMDTNWLDITKYHTGDLMTRLTSDVNVLGDGISTSIPTIVRLIIELFISFGTLAFFDIRLALLALVFAPISAISSVWIGRKIKRLQVKVQESESKYRSFIQESLANILIVKSFCTEDYSVNRLTELRDERLYWILKRSRMGILASTIMGLAFQLGYVVAFAWGVVSISRSTITFGTMTVFLTLFNRIQAPLVNLAQMIPRLVGMVASAGRIMELQSLPEEKRFEGGIMAGEIGVKINELTFGYTDEVVLENITMDIQPGEFTAIVGRSGIGKTTLIRLIMAFTNAAAGCIKFYNKNGEQEEANANSRDFISYVPQGNTLFSGTIAGNVRMGKLDATDEEVIEALKGASAYDFVMELPDGVNTVIGEKGYGISEGQAQRVAIARALIKRAPFLILDEATSSLDEATELKVLDGLRQWNPSPTCLLITHRRSVLQYCDREIRIRDKQIDEVTEE